MSYPYNDPFLSWKVFADQISSTSDSDLSINHLSAIGDLSNNVVLQVGTNMNAYGSYFSNNVNACRVPSTNVSEVYTPNSGYMRLNSTTTKMEYYTGQGWIEMNFAPYFTLVSPSYVNANVSTLTLYTITGRDFDSSAFVVFIGDVTGEEFVSPQTTYVSSTELTALEAEGMSDASANSVFYIRVENASTSLSYSSPTVYLSFNTAPVWTYTGLLPGTGTSGVTYDLASPIANLVATDENVPITYYYNTAPVPSTIYLDASSGAIYGTMPELVNATSYAFSANAFDGLGSKGRVGNFVLQVVPTALSVTGYTLTTDYTITYVDTSNNVIASPTTSSFTVYTFKKTDVSGIVVPNFTGTITYLVVAGGGGGGGGSGSFGGGGGAGGYIASSQSVTRGTPYDVRVGSGGAAGPTMYAGTNGNNSIFGSSTAIGGGGGAGTNYAAKDGGSGGGGCVDINTAGNGTGTQGHKGGLFWNIVTSRTYGGPGGGASGVGQNTSYVGGPGATYNITGGNAVTYATGGYGSSAGPAATVANSGNGGRGGNIYVNQESVAGSSGIVVLRFPSITSYVFTTNSGTVTGYAPGQYVVSYVDASNSVVAFPTVGGSTIYSFLATGITGTFRPNFTASVDFLMIAGGGSGGTILGTANTPYQASGGGAGGYRTSYGPAGSSGGASNPEAKRSLVANTSYTVVVGAGGQASTTTNLIGTNGSSSQFGSITCTGGGGGGKGGSTSPGSSGGSGGGANAPISTAKAGAGFPSQGCNGVKSLYNGGGSGGGALSVPTATTDTNLGCNGGDGQPSSITGVSVTRAGGGGGGTNSSGAGGSGGAGGGGAGGSGGVGDGNAGAAGLANTGSGGGGGSLGTSGGVNIGIGGDGGSGIVIIRFPSFS